MAWSSRGKMVTAIQCEREDDNAPVAGSYTMRATFTDVFGRPAIAYEIIFLQE